MVSIPEAEAGPAFTHGNIGICHGSKKILYYFKGPLQSVKLSKRLIIK